ncbi:MAG: hypothetical protein ACI4FZ_05000 [Lachnospiraceae bacterium]
MSNLFEFQEKTIDEIVVKFKHENILVLLGEKDSGKSVTVKELTNHFDYARTIYFLGNASLEYTDFGCFPQNLLDEYNTGLSKRNYLNSIKKDIATTVANIIFVSVENTLDSFLTSNEKSEINDIICFITELSKTQQIYLIFDNIERFDKKSMVFLYNLIALIIKGGITKIKVLIVLDKTDKNAKQTILNQELLEQLPRIELAKPTDTDLSHFIDSENYTLARNIPIKYLLTLESNCNNLVKYYNEKLESAAQENNIVKRALYTLILLDEEVSFNNLSIFLSDLPMTELFEGMETLKKHSLIEWHEIENNIFYTVPELIKTTIRQELPVYLSVNRYELYVRQIEQHSSLDYILKYWLYNKAGNIDNAYANAILAYCSIARGETNCTNEELETFDNFLQASPYKKIYDILSKAYRLYNINEYKECYLLINNYLTENQFIIENSIFFSVYIPEFILEMIFIRGMCIGRLSNCDEELIRNQQRLLEQSIEIIKLSTFNNDLILRMREQKLLLKTYLSLQSKAKQAEIYNEYFSICNQYQSYIRESTIRTREKWEIRYASFLLKANIVSGIPDKLHILEKGYDILNRNKDCHPEKYLKAACNLAGDYMWRDKMEYSHYILENAVGFIEKKNWLQRWGIIYQMYIFSKLYGNISASPQELFIDYTEKIWNRPEIKFKMHEMVICNSNYAILLAASGDLVYAHNLLQETLNILERHLNYYNEYLISTNLGMIKYLLGDVSGALELETHCKELIDKKKVPTFSYAFLKKRTHILHDIYLAKRPIDNVLVPLNAQQTLSTGYCSDNYFRPLLFSDINYWAD